jgi:hypothetical protein
MRPAPGLLRRNEQRSRANLLSRANVLDKIRNYLYMIPIDGIDPSLAERRARSGPQLFENLGSPQPVARA